MPSRHTPPPPNLDTDLLRAFATLVDTGSFTRTGELLGRTQSAVSVQIKRLEDQVGARLCDRSGRSVVPTPAGEQLLDYARRILSINDEAVGRLVMPPVRGTVRLGTAEEFATQFLSDILAEFARWHLVHEWSLRRFSRSSARSFTPSNMRRSIAKPTGSSTAGPKAMRVEKSPEQATR